MAKKNYVKIGDTKIIHGVCVTCIDTDNAISCCDCEFLGENCDDIPCQPTQRNDEKFVYFKRIEKV